MKGKNEAPVLLIAFNRPDTTQIVFNSIREVKPKKLYVAIDGPRNSKPGEADLCKQVLEITKQVDWTCDAEYLIRDTNLGCKLGVSGAITWALENEDRVIVIEDDIVAVPAFYYFAEEMLEKHKDDNRIAMVSANNYTPFNSNNSDYLFTKYGHIWGWATWKRVWDKFDLNVPELQVAIDENLSKMQFLSEKEKKYYKMYFQRWLTKINSHTENAWGPQFFFFRQYNNLLSIIPKVNLASNIGANSSRNDVKSKTNENYYPAENNFVLIKYPNRVECNLEYDNYHFKKLINHRTPLIFRIIKKALRVLKLS